MQHAGAQNIGDGRGGIVLSDCWVLNVEKKEWRKLNDIPRPVPGNGASLFNLSAGCSICRRKCEGK